MKFLGCMLTHWLPMASILFNIARICNSQFKCNYLTIEKHFLNFLFHFWILHDILNILKKKVVIANVCNFWNLHQILKSLIKKMIFIANLFPKLQTVKNFVRLLCRKRCFGTRFDSQNMKVPRLYSWRLGEFATLNSNAIISQVKNIFSFFSSILESR